MSQALAAIDAARGNGCTLHNNSMISERAALSGAGAPGAEIEITDDMVEAGVSAYHAINRHAPADADSIVVTVFQAMRAVEGKGSNK